jgi:hypothetical protein
VVWKTSQLSPAFSPSGPVSKARSRSLNGKYVATDPRSCRSTRPFSYLRRTCAGLREAKGRPITANEIAVQAMKDKNLDMGDGALRLDITRQFMWTLTRMLKTGAVTN